MTKCNVKKETDWLKLVSNGYLMIMLQKRPLFLILAIAFAVAGSIYSEQQ